MGRRKTFDESEARQKIMRRFWRHGYADTSVQDLEKASGLSSGSLYHSFGGKTELYISALVAYMDSVVEPRINRCLEQEDPLAGFERYFREILIESEKSLSWGCFVMNTSTNPEQFPGSVIQLSQSFQRRIDQAIERAVERGQALGDFCTEQPASALARRLQLMLAGCLVRHQQGSSEAVRQTDLKLLLDTLKAK